MISPRFSRRRGRLIWAGVLIPLAGFGLLLVASSCGRKAEKETPAPAGQAAVETTPVAPPPAARPALTEPSPVVDDLAALQKLDQNLPATQLNLGDYYLKRGDIQSALKAYRRSIEINPRYVQGFNNLGLAQLRAGDSAAAEASFKHAIAIDASYATAFCNLGTLYLRQQKNAQAQLMLETSVRADSMNAVACSMLGVARRRSGDMNGAITMYLRALKLDPMRATDHVQIANIYYDKQLYEDAYERCRMALEIDPNLEQARKMMKVMEESNLLVRNKPKTP